MRIFSSFILIVALLPSGASAVMNANDAPTKKVREGLAGCGCFWQVRYNTEKLSTRFTFDLQSRIQSLGPAVHIKLGADGLNLVRVERDRCDFKQSKKYRDYIAESEAKIVALAAELAAEGQAMITCGELADFPPDFCSCPVGAVKLGN